MERARARIRKDTKNLGRRTRKKRRPGRGGSERK
jgi:hypothetical protein